MVPADAEANHRGRNPIAIGHPGVGYPMPWAVHSWVPGTIAARADVSQSGSFAVDLGSLIAALRAIPTVGRTFSGDGRGGELRAHDEWMARCFRESVDLVPVDRLQAMWTQWRELPSPASVVMSHKDLTPANVLIEGGRLAGVIDVGDFGPADPALDLVGLWHLLDRDRRASARRLLNVDDGEWARGQAWALQQAMGAVWYYRTTNPVMHAMALTTLQRLLEDQ